MKKNIKKYIALFFLMVAMFALSACGYTKEEKKLIDKYEKMGEENAIAYIEKKYGFTPDVIEVECVTVGSEWTIDFTPPPTGDVYVKMQDEKVEKKFWVYTTGEKSSLDECWDNYQHKEIEVAIKNQLETFLGTEMEHLEVAYGVNNEVGRSVNDTSKLERQYGLIHKYFDGDNLVEILDSSDWNKILACIVTEKDIPDVIGCSVGELTEDGIYEADVEKSEKLVQLLGINTDCFIVNYKDKESCKLAHMQQDTSHSVEKTDLNYDMEKMAFFIKDHYYLIGRKMGDKLNSEYVKYEVKKFDEFYYVQVGGTYCNFTKVDGEMQPASDWNGRGFIDAKKVFGEYTIDSDARKIYFFIPISTLEVEDLTTRMIEEAGFRLVEQREYEKEENQWELSYGTEHFSIIDDFSGSDKGQYLTTTLYLQDFYRNYIFSVFVDQDDLK